MAEKTCIACRKNFSHDKIIEEAGIPICTTCKDRKSISPGQYAFGLRLWEWISFTKTKDDPYLSFWPLENGKPMMIGSILETVVANDRDILPCGSSCSCGYTGQQQTATTSNICIFYRLDRMMPDRRAALLIYWWYRIYSTQEKAPHQNQKPAAPQFWPSYKGRPLSPQEVVREAIC